MKRTPVVTVSTSCGHGGFLFRFAQPAVNKMAAGLSTDDLTDHELLALCLILKPDYLVSSKAVATKEPGGNPMLDLLCVEAGSVGEEQETITTRCPVEAILVEGIVQVQG